MTTTGLPDWPWAGIDAGSLPPAERLVIDAARAWAAALHQGRPQKLVLQEVLLAEGAEAVAEALHEALRQLAHHPLTLGCPLCPRLIGQEALLLTILAAAQRHRRMEALGLLLRHLPPRPAYAAMAALVSTAAGLARAGLRLREPWLRQG
jgi:hypothetical protein